VIREVLVELRRKKKGKEISMKEVRIAVVIEGVGSEMKNNSIIRRKEK